MESVLDNTLPIGKPKWLKVKLPIGQKYTELRGLVDKYKLNTICTSGSCTKVHVRHQELRQLLLR